MLCALLASLVSLVGAPPAHAANTNSVNFSVERGFITGPITVELTAGAGQTIRYSTAWGDQWSAADFNAGAQTYTGPIQISGSTQLRAMAIGDEHVVSHTYINLSGYSAQDQAIIESYPAMVTTGSSVGSRDADARTIVEFWHPNGDGDSAPAGIRNRQGGIGQNGDFRLYFRDEYGDGRLDYELFPNEPSGAQTSGGYDKVNFHGGSQDAFDYSWAFNHCNQGAGTLMRDRFLPTGPTSAERRRRQRRVLHDVPARQSGRSQERRRRAPAGLHGRALRRRQGQLRTVDLLQP